MTPYFNNIETIAFRPQADIDELAYRFYEPNRLVAGKTMAEHLRIAICYWHTLCWSGGDAFGGGTRAMPWLTSDLMQTAYHKADAMFELVTKLDVPFFTFHDTDIAPEAPDLKTFFDQLSRVIDYIEQKMSDTGVRLLWGTANLFSHARYQAGAATNPDPAIFTCAAAQVFHALNATHRLGGENYVLWGGREGYDTLLNTNLKQEKAQLAQFLHLVVEHKYKIGFKGGLLIEPKPCEPTKHQYDHDTETVYGFLHQHGLEKEFQVNIEANHATLAGHSFHHEIATACALDCLGSIDANRGDQQNGWDTDQFPNSVEELSLVMHELLNHGGLTTGGFNFDAKVRRQSIDPIDVFHGHVGGIDVLARSLLVAEQMLKSGTFDRHTEKRYQGWQQTLGMEILQGQHSLTHLAEQALQHPESDRVSGRQEQWENMHLYSILQTQ